MRDDFSQWIHDAYERVVTVPAGRSAGDYYPHLIGAALASLFCFFLASLILRSRRGNATDRALSFVVLSYGILSAFAVYRLLQGFLYIAFITPLLWVVVTAAEAVAVYFIIRELHSRSEGDRYDRK